MKAYRNLIITSLAIFFTVACGSNAFAQTIAGEDFDGGTTNGGFTSTASTTFEGDFDAATFVAHDNTCNGLFDFCSGSRFDRFGIVNATVADNSGDEGLPFDHIDDSANAGNLFLTDRLGVLSGGVDNSAFGLADTLNDSNIDSTGLVSASWTFDISSGSNMQMSIDMAAIGDFDNGDGAFETDDFMTFTYSIDGGASQTAFDVRPEADGLGMDTGVFYTVTMDGGVEYDRYFIPSAFFNETSWTQLTTSGPFGSVVFHPDDIDQDGFVTQEGAFGTEEVRALTSGGFDNTELEVFKDAMIVNGVTPLDNNFQTVTVPIVGSGTTLTLKLLAVADGSLEFSVFDNILIEEVAAIDVDLDNDGDVDGNDFLLIQRTDPSLIPQWALEFGSVDSIAAVGTVPEPATLGLLTLGLGLIVPVVQRRKR